MADEEQLEILKQGVNVWNRWRKAHPEVAINLNNADFRGIMLSGYHNTGGVDLSAANIVACDFSDASLGLANFAYANLGRTNLSKAFLRKANLMGTNLAHSNCREANFNEASLENAYLTGTNLEEAILESAMFGNTVIGATDLSTAIGIEKAVHYRPSTIGVDTIQLSKGKIPPEFLRGFGLSDMQIEYAKLANPGLDSEQVTNITYKIHQLYLGGGIQYYSCFISYSSKDREFAQRLHDDLQNNGVRCWFDREDLRIGDAIRPMIDRQIRLRDKLLVILSENSIKSEWVGDEVEGALEEEQKGNRSVLFPIRLDDTALNTRDDWAAKIKRRRHIGDFSNWKDKASYQMAFERLLRDLKETS